MKQCRHCGQMKEYTEFTNRAASEDGKDSYCQICCNTRNKRYQAKNRQKFLAQQKRYREKTASTTRIYRQTPGPRFAQGRASAVRRGLDWQITFESFVDLISRPCFYCEKSLVAEAGHSLDRIDNAKGYSLDNVLPCCGTCNKTRNTFFTVDEMKMMMKALQIFRGQKSA